MVDKEKKITHTKKLMDDITEGRVINKIEKEKKGGIIQAPFRKYHLDEEGKDQDTFTLRLNKEERVQLDRDKKAIQQKKDSTAIKQLWKIASIVIHDQKMRQIIDTIQGNKRRNERAGIVEFE